VQLENKIAIVTGAAAGIGRATAFMMAKEGAQIVAADINEQGLMQTVAAIKEQSRADRRLRA
jgi:NAD(P)-dependent dehydrogenase (short-subunit alcohol dehydrogenase family)